jgi:hypothetical protein
MKEKNDIAVMNEEINRRIADDAWDLRIAGRVLSRRRSRVTRSIMAGAGGMAAAAASILLVFAPPGRNSGNDAVFHAFVSSQVNGTYEEVFTNGNDGSGSVPATSTLVSYSSLDSVISDALMDR